MTLNRDSSLKYLELYLGHAEWDRHVDSILWPKMQKKFRDGAAEEMRKQIACAVLLPYLTSSRVPPDPTDLLHRCRYYDQFLERDWVEELEKIMEQDKVITQYRAKCLIIGRVEKIKLSPMTRQAFNWMYASAKEKGFVTEDNENEIAQKLKNLIYAYGGNVINNIYMKNRRRVDKIHSWNSNYFMERLIFDIYSLEQVLKIKKQELDSTNEKLVVGISKTGET